MIGIIVTGHGNFASGISSAVKLVAGSQENYEIVDFLETDSGDMLRQRLTKAVERLDNCEDILVFSDLIGGSPFKIAVEISLECSKNIHVIAGTNVGMILEQVMLRNDEDSVEALVEKALETGKNQVIHFSLPNAEPYEDEDMI